MTETRDRQVRVITLTTRGADDGAMVKVECEDFSTEIHYVQAPADVAAALPGQALSLGQAHVNLCDHCTSEDGPVYDFRTKVQ